MLTLTCELQFPDGATITAVVKAESYETDYPAVLSGAVDRLPEALRVGKMQQAIGWELDFKSLASDTGAKCTLTHHGRYDWWAE